MRKSVLIILSCITFSSIAYSQDSMDNQLEKLKQAEIQIQNKKKLAEQEQQRQEKLKRIEHQKIEAKRQAELSKQRKLKQQLIQKEKQKIQNYEDKLNAIKVEEKRLELESKKALVKRADDYIDQDLKKLSAETDVIQSQADGTRNVTSGTKAYLESTGLPKPVVKSEKYDDKLYLIIGILSGMIVMMFISGIIFLFIRKK